MSYMLKLILALGSVAAAASVQAQAIKTAPYEAPTKAAKPVAKKAAPESGPIPGVPAGAVKIDDNTYRFQEKDASGKPGKVWLYRRNPFGVSKVEEQQAANIGKPLPPTESPATVTDLGDSYRFERSGPFGAKVWTKKKTDLTPEERALAGKNDQSNSGTTAASTQKAVN